MDQKRLRQKVLLNLASSPITLIPLIIGVTLLLGIWTFSIKSAIAAITGVGALVVGAGTFLTRLFIGDEKVQEKTIADLRREREQQQIDELDQLDEELTTDRDSRTQKMLRDLRALVKTFKESSYDDNLNVASLLDITAGVEQLFAEGVRMLRKSLEFHRTAREINDSATREGILSKREELLEDVQKSIDQLGKLLTNIQEMNIKDDSAQERIRQDLRDNFEVVKKVRERMLNITEIRSLREEGDDKEAMYA